MPTCPSVLHLQDGKFVYAGANSGVVQSPVAFCRQHVTCQDCVLARDPYCAWSSDRAACITLPQTSGPSRYWQGNVLHAAASQPGKACACA